MGRKHVARGLTSASVAPGGARWRGSLGRILGDALRHDRDVAKRDEPILVLGDGLLADLLREPARRSGIGGVTPRMIVIDDPVAWPERWDRAHLAEMRDFVRELPYAPIPIAGPIAPALLRPLGPFVDFRSRLLRVAVLAAIARGMIRPRRA